MSLSCYERRNSSFLSLEVNDEQLPKLPLHQYHRFLDEAGDTTFYGKGKIPIIGNEGVSCSFLIGMLTLHEPVAEVRERVITLQKQIANDAYFVSVPSIQKKKNAMGYFLHAKDDVPEVRKMAFELIANTHCRFDVVVGRKDYSLYEKKHKGNQSEFYADLLSHLLIDSLNGAEKLALNIAHRSKCTTHKNLQQGLEKAMLIAARKYPESSNNCQMVFNVQQPTTEPIINVVDYCLWAVQRYVERGEFRYMEFLKTKIHSVNYLYREQIG